MPDTLNVIFGPCAAGKTTYAHALARRESAVPFVLDEWGAPLFGPDAQGPIEFPWMLERLATVVERSRLCRSAELQIPALVFVIGAIMSFATGTSYGTFSIMVPAPRLLTDACM